MTTTFNINKSLSLAVTVNAALCVRLPQCNYGYSDNSVVLFS